MLGQGATVDDSNNEILTKTEASKIDMNEEDNYDLDEDDFICDAEIDALMANY